VILPAELEHPGSDPLLQAASLGYVAGRSGDLVVVSRPGWVFGTPRPAANHFCHRGREMTNPFEDLQTAFSNVTGIDFVLAGIILGAILTVALLIALTWILGSERRADNTTFLISAGLGIALSTAVGWFPIWIVVFVGIIIVFIIVDPFSGRSASE